MALRGKKQPEESNENQLIDINAQMQGSLSFVDPVNLRINGNFNGSLDTKGTLTIGEKAIIEANITGDNIVIAGRVTGDINAHRMLVLMPTAVLKGNISTPKLNIVEGAILQGNCKMMEGLLNIDEVSKYLEIDLTEIENLANSGEIPAQKAGNTWTFERSEIDHWAASGRLNNTNT